MQRVMSLALLAITVLTAGCAANHNSVQTVTVPPMIGQAKTGAEKVRLDQLHLLAEQDAAKRR